MSDTNKYGMTSWDDPAPVSGNKPNRKDSWIKLKNGSNVIRCITDPYRYITHNFKEEGDSGIGEKINCSKPLHGTCPICSKPGKENAPKMRWYLGVIDRETDTAKIMDVGPFVYKAILALTRDADYGSPTKYDIDIKVNKEGGPTGYYTVIPKPPKAMTANDINHQASFDVEGLQKRCTPLDLVSIQEKIDAYRTKRGHKVEKAQVEDVSFDQESGTVLFPNAD